MFCVLQYDTDMLKNIVVQDILISPWKCMRCHYPESVLPPPPPQKEQEMKVALASVGGRGGWKEGTQPTTVP